MSKARPQTEPRRMARLFDLNPFRRKNNRKNTSGRHNQHLWSNNTKKGALIRHTAY